MKTLALFLVLLISPFSVAADKDQPPIKVVMFSGSSEYNSKDSLRALKAMLEEKYNCQCTVNDVEEKGKELTGIEGLETADVAVFFTRRVSLAEDQIAKIKKYIASGKG